AGCVCHGGCAGGDLHSFPTRRSSDLLYQLTHSTLQVGLLSLCELFPLLTLTIVGGAIADAFDRRRLLLWTEALLAVVSGGLAFKDRKSTRLNSSHLGISYAVFCLKKK